MADGRRAGRKHSEACRSSAHFLFYNRTSSWRASCSVFDPNRSCSPAAPQLPTTPQLCFPICNSPSLQFVMLICPWYERGCPRSLINLLGATPLKKADYPQANVLYIVPQLFENMRALSYCSNFMPRCCHAPSLEDHGLTLCICKVSPQSNASLYELSWL